MIFQDSKLKKMAHHLQEMPLHCALNYTSKVSNSSLEDEEYLTNLLTLEPAELGCYELLRDEDKSTFFQYEELVGGYCNCIVGFLGLVGNVLSIVVLSQREMQKNNCFNKLLIGERVV